MNRNSKLEKFIKLFPFLFFPLLSFSFLSFPFLSCLILCYEYILHHTRFNPRFSVVRIFTRGRVLLPTFFSATSSPSHLVAKSTFVHHCSKPNLGKSSFPWPDLDRDLDRDRAPEPEPDATFNSPSPGVLCNYQLERGSSSLSLVIQGQSSVAKFTSSLQFNISRLRLVLASGGSPMREPHDIGILS